MADSNGNHRRINWDNNLVDRLLHIASPLVLIAAAVFILAVVSNSDEPKRQMVCQFPDTFTRSFMAYGSSVCSGGLAEHYIAVNDSLPPTIDNMQKVSLPPMPLSYREVLLDVYVRNMLLMAIMCIGPFTAWSLLGKADGLGILHISHISSKLALTKSFGSMAWYVVSRVASGIVALICCTKIRGYSVIAEQSGPSDEPLSIMCSYRVRRLGANMHNFVLPCVHSISNDNGTDANIAWLRNVLFIWFLGLTILLVLNAVFTIVVCIISFLHGFRKAILHKMVDGGDGRSDDFLISPSQAFVVVMAARNGYGQMVSEIFKAQMSSFITKQS